MKLIQQSKILRPGVLLSEIKLSIIWEMIQSQLRKVAKGFGIKNAYQFQKFTGFTISMAYSLWKDEWQLVHLKTLNTLCNMFRCTPNDLIKFVPDPDEK